MKNPRLYKKLPLASRTLFNLSNYRDYFSKWLISRLRISDLIRLLINDDGMLDASIVHPHGCVIFWTDDRFNHCWCSEWFSAIPTKTHFLGISRTNQQEEHFSRRETWKVLFIRVERQLRKIRRRRNPKKFSWAWIVMLMVPRKIQQRDPIMMPECTGIHGRVNEVLGN